MKSKIHLLLTLLILLSGTQTTLLAQSKGTIRGKVTDGDTGQGLPGVNVIVKGTYYGAATDLDGNYEILRVNPGVYTVEASMIGFKQVQNTGVLVNPAETTELDKL